MARLLIVDDDVQLARMLGQFLAGEGFANAHAADGAQALEQLARDRFDASPVPNVHPVRRIMPFIMPTKNGAFVLFEVEGEPRGTHILSTGVVDPAIGADDAPLLDPAAQYIGDRAPARVPLVAAPGKNGGLIFVWTDGRDAPQGALRARWLTSSLQPDPTEPATPRMIPTANADYADVRAANSDGAGGLYVAWGDYPASDPNGVVMMNRVLASEFLSAPPSGRPSTLALSAPRPNPAHGAVALDVTLPDDSPARVELLDVAGRVVRSQTLQGAGVHSVSFDALGGVPPGLYFARVTARSGAQGTRLVVSR